MNQNYPMTLIGRQNWWRLILQDMVDALPSLLAVPSNADEFVLVGGPRLVRELPDRAQDMVIGHLTASREVRKHYDGMHYRTRQGISRQLFGVAS